MKRMSVLCSLLLLTVVACAAPPSESAHNDEIAAGSAAWGAALNAGDIDALVAIYTDDALLMPPNAPSARGEEILRAVFGGMIEAGMQGTIQTVELRSAADIGYHIGTYELTLDGAVVDTGKFIETWRQVDGQWKMANDIFNSDNPPAPAEPENKAADVAAMDTGHDSGGGVARR